MDTELLKLLDSLRNKFDSKIHDNFAKLTRYYTGDFSEADGGIKNNENVTNGIVETKVTQVVQAEITTTIVPSNMTFSDANEIKVVDQLASVLDDLSKHVQRINAWDIFREDTCRTGGIIGTAIARCSWDYEAADGLGDVKVEELDPMLCKWDTSATEVEGMNWFFYEPEINILTLKKKYGVDEQGNINQEMMDKLNSLTAMPKDKDKPEESMAKGVINYTANSTSGQAYTYGTTGMQRSTDNIKVIECYIKDDSVFMPAKGDGTQTEAKKEEWRFQYPNGRYIVYVSQNNNRFVLEDRPIDYPFGFPIDMFTWMPSRKKGEKLIGLGEVKNLIPIQDRINKLYNRLSKCIQQYQSYIAFDPTTTGLKADGSDFTDDFLIAVKNLAQSPLQIVTNNTLAEINNLLELIQHYRQSAMNIARINDTMLSGKHESGVTSAKQVESLKQNPLTAIDAIIRRYKSFLLKVTNKSLKLVQLYYNVPRMVRIAEGKQFAEIPAREEQVTNPQTGAPMANPKQPPIRIFDAGTMKVVKEIQSDLSLYGYECEVIAGAGIARSPQENAALTMQLVQMGVFSGEMGLETVKLILRANDYPNRNSIIAELEKKQAEQSNQPAQMPQAKDLGVQFKDLPPFAQAQWLTAQGFQVPADPMAMMPAQAPQVPVNP